MGVKLWCKWDGVHVRDYLKNKDGYNGDIVIKALFWDYFDEQAYFQLWSWKVVYVSAKYLSAV